MSKQNFISVLMISGVLVLTSCATTEKTSIKNYREGTLEINDGKKNDRAIQIERQIYKLKKDPENWRIKNNLMVLYREKGEFELAIRYGRSILHMDTKNYVALNNLAMVYFDMRNYKYALYLLKKAMLLNSKDPAIHVNLGMVFLEKNEYSLAGDQFKRAHGLKSDFYPAIKNLGLYYFKTGSYGHAVPYLKKIIELEGSDIHRNMLAISYRKTGDQKKSYSLYQEVLRNDPRNIIAVFNSAIIELDYLNQPAIALEKFKKLKIWQQRSPAKNEDSRIDDYINRAMSMKMLKES